MSLAISGVYYVAEVTIDVNKETKNVVKYD